MLIRGEELPISPGREISIITITRSLINDRIVASKRYRNANEAPSTEGRTRADYRGLAAGMVKIQRGTSTGVWY